LPASDAEYYRLRTEWLRFKSQLHDGLTGLPALPALVEDVRRALESAGTLDVLSLDPGRSGWHEMNLGWAAYDDTVREFAALLASLRASGELPGGALVCLHTVRSDRFLVFLPEGPEPSGQAERLVAALHERLAAAPADSALRSVRLLVGSARLRADPMIRAERAIHQAVADAACASLMEREGREAVRRHELARMIEERGVRTVFHPIVRLSDGRVVGHEALTRPLRQGVFDSVEELFAFAESTDLLLDFERLCRATAIRASVDLPLSGLLFLNASARAVEDPQWSSGEIEAQLAHGGLTPRDVVVEITERVAIVSGADFQEALRLFKQRGYRVAVDDMGAGYSSLQSLAAIEPDFLKFDVSLVRDIDRYSIKRSLLESLRNLGEKIHARVIAEGVEREEERDTLLQLGVELAQGFLFHEEEPCETRR
jgi:EAL domain-containing protein (putative c-di-GMP-specific phosphodiesterase class I)